MSAALPTVAGPAPSVSIAVPAAVTVPVAQSASSPRETGPATVDARTAAQLQPAGALTPILPATGVGNGQ
jgi:hypothetical protein